MSEFDQLDRIFAEGTSNSDYTREGKPSNKITCADGFTLSVVAGGGSYCYPRPGFGADRRYEGPFQEVEVGFPSERPEPWSEWKEWCESPTIPTNTVYGYVPKDAVRALVDLHGGLA